MVTVTFQGTTTENLIRQIKAFAEKVELQEKQEKGGRDRERKQAPSDSGRGSGV